MAWIRDLLNKMHTISSDIVAKRAIYKETSADAESQYNNNNLKCESTITNINSIEVSWELSSKKYTEKIRKEERQREGERKNKGVVRK